MGRLLIAVRSVIRGARGFTSKCLSRCSTEKHARVNDSAIAHWLLLCSTGSAVLQGFPVERLALPCDRIGDLGWERQAEAVPPRIHAVIQWTPRVYPWVRGMMVSTAKPHQSHLLADYHSKLEAVRPSVGSFIDSPAFITV
jgi:hypothetical protein